MPVRRRGGFGGTHLLDMRGTVRDWAPPGWHWEESGVRRLVRNPGPVVDPDLVWWHLRGPAAVQREPAPEEVVQRRIREEDEHVNRYVLKLDTPAVYNSGWMVLHRDPSHVSIAPVMVPALWVRSAGRSAPLGLGPGKS